MNGAGAVAGGNGNYRIEVADFGPIRRAAVDLRPLTVFAGPSNTGKSYLAMLVYALHQCFSPSFQKPHEPIRARHMFSFNITMAEALMDQDDLRESIANWWAQLGRNESAPLPDDLARAFRSVLERIPGSGRYVEQEVNRCFGTDVAKDLVRRESADHRATIALHLPDERGREQARYRVDFGSKGVEVAGQFNTLPEVSGFSAEDSDLPGYYDEDPSFLLSSAVNAMFESLTRPLTRRAYYLPSDRTGVMHSHQVVVSALIQRATAAGLRPSESVPLLSGVLADFLNGLIWMNQPRRTPLRKLADVLEQNLLAGAVRLNRSETGYPSFAYRPAKWDSDVPLMRTSSMVSELAPVVLYLRYLVEPGDLLIIEEPESHLHPALQTAFARELARLVHSGVRVLLTTHSEWILEALANLVRLSELPEERREGIPGADVALTPDQVGAWLFRPDSDGAGSAVEEIPLDTEAGSFPAGFGEVTESLYNEWARIANRIEAAKADQND